MIECISFYEESWMIRAADRQQWNHVARAFGSRALLFDLDHFVWDEAFHNPGGLPVYLFDEDGDCDLESFQHPDDGIYVFGITHVDIKNIIPERAGVVQIITPQAVPLWGCQAAAIVLADRERKRGRND